MEKKKKKQQPQTSQNLYKQANLKQDMTSVVLLPCNRAIRQCHVNGTVRQRRLLAQKVLDVVMADQKLLTSTHVLSKNSRHFSSQIMVTLPLEG